MVPYKSCFMHYPQISNFYFANLKTQPFLKKLDGPLEPMGLHDIAKLFKTKC